MHICIMRIMRTTTIITYHKVGGAKAEAEPITRNTKHVKRAARTRSAIHVAINAPLNEGAPSAEKIETP